MSICEPGLAQRLCAVRRAIAEAEAQAHRASGSVTLLTVSKTFDESALQEAITLGVRAFGENYAQEGCRKIDFFREHAADIDLTWHFIGPLQANKTRMVAERFDWVQSIDRLKIAQRLSAQRPCELPALNVLIEVNIDQEESKSGVLPQALLELATQVSQLPRLTLRGLMAIPSAKATPEKNKESFRAMKTLFDWLISQGFKLDTLSMGMSADMHAAIQEGATMVRVGSAIFGARDYGQTQPL